jgi:hypothetical protein
MIQKCETQIFACDRNYQNDIPRLRQLITGAISSWNLFISRLSTCNICIQLNKSNNPYHCHWSNRLKLPYITYGK